MKDNKRERAKRAFMRELDTPELRQAKVKKIIIHPQKKLAGTEFDMGDTLVKYNLKDRVIQLNVGYHRGRDRVEFKGIHANVGFTDTNSWWTARYILDGLADVVASAESNREACDHTVEEMIERDLEAMNSDFHYFHQVGVRAELDGDCIVVNKARY